MRTPDFYRAAADFGARRAEKLRSDLRSRRHSAAEIDDVEMLAECLEAGAEALRNGKRVFPMIRKAPTPPPPRPTAVQPPVEQWKAEVAVLNRCLGRVMAKWKLENLRRQRATLLSNMALVEQRDRLVASLLADDELLDQLNSKIAALMAPNEQENAA